MELLCLTHAFDATDPRDKVYALLSFQVMGSYADKSGQSTLTADYTKSLPEVYRDLALHFMLCSGRLEVLSYIHPQSLQHPSCGGRSWVPDWTYREASQFWSILREYDRDVVPESTVSMVSKQPFKLTGLILGHVLQSYCRREDYRFYTLTEIYKIWRSVWRSVEQLILDHAPISDLTTGLMVATSLAYCLTGGMDENWTPVPPPKTTIGQSTCINEVEAHVRQNLADFAAVVQPCQDTEEGPEHLEKDDEKACLIQQGMSERVKALYPWAKCGSTERIKGLHGKLVACAHALFCTDAGILGLGHETLEKGDVIALLFGSNFPIQLRPVGLAYRVIGECYAFGCMDGEPVREWKAGKRSETVFELF